MSRAFFRGTTPELRWASLSFLVAATGVALGFLGFAISVRVVSIFGFAICFAGISMGFIAIGLGLFRWLKNTREHLNKRA